MVCFVVLVHGVGVFTDGVVVHHADVIWIVIKLETEVFSFFCPGLEPNNSAHVQMIPNAIIPPMVGDGHA